MIGKSKTEFDMRLANFIQEFDHEEQPMSDTLQEEEDQKTTVEWHNFVPQDEYNVRLCAICGFGKDEHYRQFPRRDQTAWLECCQGYAHAPWCANYGPRYKSTKEVTEHEPAARGGGSGICTEEGKPHFRTSCDHGKWIHGYDGDRYHIRAIGNDDCIAHADKFEQAEQIVTEHNQHRSLVAERERLRQVIRDEIAAINVWKNAIHPRSDVQEGLSISLSKLEVALADQKERRSE